MSSCLLLCSIALIIWFDDHLFFLKISAGFDAQVNVFLDDFISNKCFDSVSQACLNISIYLFYIQICVRLKESRYSICIRAPTAREWDVTCLSPSLIPAGHWGSCAPRPRVSWERRDPRNMRAAQIGRV